MITNEREQGKLELRKDFVGTAGKANLYIKHGATTDDSELDAGDNGTTGENTLDTGSFNVSETAGTGTDLTEYQKSIECRAGNGAGAVVASSPADSAGPLNVAVGYGDDIVCVITNEREQGKLELRKDFVGTAGKANLYIKHGATTDDSELDAGDDGTTGENTLDTGSFNVSETAGTGTDLTEYQKSIECRAGNGAGAVVASSPADSAGPLNVAVGYGDDIVCVITNTRETGQIQLKKHWVGTAGSVSLEVKQGSTVKASGTANGADGQTTTRPWTRAPTR